MAKAMPAATTHKAHVPNLVLRTSVKELIATSTTLVCKLRMPVHRQAHV